MNGDIFDPRVNGIEEVIQSYKNALENINLYGPTYFSEILDEFNSKAEAANVTNDNQIYHVLLIITDGIINDMQKTIDEIVRGSNLPVAVIIVGVGSADFSSMD